MQAQEKNRLKAPGNQEVHESIEDMLQHIAKVIDTLNQQIREMFDTYPMLKELTTVLEAVPGIGPVNSWVLIALLPELGKTDRRRLASLVGVAPHPRDSGTYSGYRSTSGGRQNVRTKLFTAALSVSRSKSSLGGYYQGLLQRSKKKMSAIVALMNKILTILNARMRDFYAARES